MTVPVPPVGDESPHAAQMPDGLPLASGSCVSLWLDTVQGDPLLDYRSKQWPSEAEVVIIGSGISGATIAYTLLTSTTPPSSIVMLEARQVCSGATGRNAGHCKPDVMRGFTKYAERHGKEQALKILANEQRTWEALVGYVKTHNVDCNLWIGNTMDTFMTHEGVVAAENNMKAFIAAGGDPSRVAVTTDPAEAEKVSKIQGAKAVYSWTASTLHPWKLVAHVLRHCLELGLNLQSRTTVTAVSPAGDGWTVHTTRGEINTPTVVYATNAYTPALLPETKGAIRPTPHLCNRVFSPHLTRALPGSYGVAYLPSLYSVNPQADGSVLFGGSNPAQDEYLRWVAEDPARGGINDSVQAFKPVRDSVKQLCRDGFGWDIDDEAVEAAEVQSWTGVIGRSADMVPWIGAVPGRPGRWMCCGHNGHGMARTFTCGPALAKMVQGASWEEAGLPECFEVTAERLAKARQ